MVASSAKLLLIVLARDEGSPLLSVEQIYDAIHFALASRFRLLRESRARKAQLGYRRHGRAPQVGRVS